jgi:hypothetical protein
MSLANNRGNQQGDWLDLPPESVVFNYTGMEQMRFDGRPVEAGLDEAGRGGNYGDRPPLSKRENGKGRQVPRPELDEDDDQDILPDPEGIAVTDGRNKARTRRQTGGLAVVDPAGHPGEPGDWQDLENMRRLQLIGNRRAEMIHNQDILPDPQTLEQIVAMRRLEG